MSNGRVYFFAPSAPLAPPKHISFTGFAMRFEHSGNAFLSIAALPHLPLSTGQLEFPLEIEA